MSTPQESNEKENVAKKGVKKMDAVVTGVILGGIIASIYGVKKLKEKQDDLHESEHMVETPKEIKRKSIIRRIFFGN